MFTLAHLSDPHLAPLPKPHWSELLNKRITGYVNWQRRRRFIHDPAVLARIVADIKAQSPDHIAVTGDIANIALPAEFVRGREWLESLGPSRDVTFVPGNHDVYVQIAANYAARQWGAQMSDDDGIAGFPFLRRRGPLAIVGVTSGVPTAPLLATGWLGPLQLAGLAETLNQLKTEKLFRVLMIHHPPVSKAGRAKALLDAPVLKRIIAAHGADLIIHGHDHIHMLNWLDGPNGTKVPAIGVPSASAAVGKAHDAAAYNLYKIDGEHGAWTCEAIARGITPGGDVVEQQRMEIKF